MQAGQAHRRIPTGRSDSSVELLVKRGDQKADDREHRAARPNTPPAGEHGATVQTPRDTRFHQGYRVAGRRVTGAAIRSAASHRRAGPPPNTHHHSHPTLHHPPPNHHLIHTDHRPPSTRTTHRPARCLPLLASGSTPTPRLSRRLRASSRSSSTLQVSLAILGTFTILQVSRPYCDRCALSKSAL